MTGEKHRIVPAKGHERNIRTYKILFACQGGHLIFKKTKGSKTHFFLKLQ